MIEAGSPYVFVRSLVVNVRNSRNRGSAGATVELDVYYRPGEAS
jgi:hypothetical protein